MTRISVVLPCRLSEERHGHSRLRLALESLIHQSIPPSEYEIVVVDDGSETPISTLLDRWGLDTSRFNVHRQPPLGMCAAFNLGAALASSDLIFLAIDDNLAHPTLLQTHIDEQSKANGAGTLVVGRELFCWQTLLLSDVIAGTKADSLESSLAVLAPAADLLQLTDFKLDPSDVRTHFNIIERISKIPPSYQDIEDFIGSKSFTKTDVGWLAMRLGNHSLPKRLFSEVGGLNTGLDPMGWYADLEFGHRLHSAAIEPVLRRDAVTVHLPHGKAYMRPEDGFASLGEFYRSVNDPVVLLVPSYFQCKMSIRRFNDVTEPIRAGGVVNAK